jgi:hypothetical protein
MRYRDRRDFLKSLGLGAMAVPLMSSLQPARGATFPRRLVIFTSPNGTAMEHYWPTDDSVTGSVILAPLTPMAKKLVVLRGINNEAVYKPPIAPNHSPDNPGILTARAPVAVGASWVIGGISIDQHVANAVARETKVPSMHVGVEPSWVISSRGFNQAMPAQFDPAVAMKQVFGDVISAPAEVERLRAERRTVLGQLARRLSASRCALGGEDAAKLGTYLESVRDLEHRVGLTLPAACRAPEVKPPPDAPAIGRAAIDVAVAALTCDATRVAHIGYGNFLLRHTWVNYSGADTPYHTLAHSATPADRRATAEIEKWYASQFLYLLQKLDAVPEGDGTLLDHSVVMWIHEQADGATHSRRDHAVVLAGGGTGAIKTGRKLHAMGATLNGLHIAVANAVGVPTERFGDPEFSRGPLPGLL